MESYPCKKCGKLFFDDVLYYPKYIHEPLCPNCSTAYKEMLNGNKEHRADEDRANALRKELGEIAYRIMTRTELLYENWVNRSDSSMDIFEMVYLAVTADNVQECMDDYGDAGFAAGSYQTRNFIIKNLLERAEKMGITESVYASKLRDLIKYHEEG